MTNLGRLYTEGQIDTKRNIIDSIFPEKPEFDGKSYRTARINVFANYIFKINNEFHQNKNRKNDYNNHFSCLVAEPEQISKHFLDDFERLISIKNKEI